MRWIDLQLNLHHASHLQFLDSNLCCRASPVIYRTSSMRKHPHLCNYKDCLYMGAKHAKTSAFTQLQRLLTCRTKKVKICNIGMQVAQQHKQMPRNSISLPVQQRRKFLKDILRKENPSSSISITRVLSPLLSQVDVFISLS